MDRSDVSFLKKMRFGELEPSLQQDIVEFAGRMGYESTITSSSSLHFLFRLYQAEKAKEKGSRRALKEAEDMILRLVNLHHDTMKNAGGKRYAGKERRRPRLALLGERMPIGKKTRDLLASIGITDGKDVETVVGLLGEKKVDERVELIKITNLGDDLVEKIFGTHTELLIVADDGAFVHHLETMENKKDMIDAWKASNKTGAPADADYDARAGVLLEDYKTIADVLQLHELVVRKEEPEARAPAERPQYQNKPMYPGDFMKVMLSMGFSVVREAKHGTLLSNAEGVVMAVQRAHKAQMQLNGSTILKKLRESGIDPGDFQGARDALGL